DVFVPNMRQNPANDRGSGHSRSTRSKGRDEIGDPILISGDAAAHDDGLYLPPWFCDLGVSWHAHRVARAPSPPVLLVDLHASGAPVSAHLGRDGPLGAGGDR